MMAQKVPKSILSLILTDLLVFNKFYIFYARNRYSTHAVAGRILSNTRIFITGLFYSEIVVVSFWRKI